MKKLKQDNFEQGRMLGCVGQTPLVLADVYDAHYLVSLMNDQMNHGSNESLDAQT